MIKTDQCSQCENTREKNRSLCKPCRSKRDYGKYRESWDESQFNSRMKCVFGISASQYWEMFDRQGGVCGICGNPETRAGRKLSVDHDHDCCPGKKSCGQCVRGLLCGSCNTAIGLLKEDLEIFSSAIAWIS